MQSIRYLFTRLPGHAQFSMISTAADRDDDSPRSKRRSTRLVQSYQIPLAFQLLDSDLLGLDPRRYALGLQLRHHILLHCRLQ